MATEPSSISTGDAIGPPTLEDYLRELTHAGNRVVDVADTGRWDDPVPPCPGWTVRTLVVHVGGALRWAQDIVANARTGRPRDMFGLMAEPREKVRDLPSEDLPGWLRDGLAALLDTLRAAPADLECWTFLPDLTGAQFWARRQLHEVGIHSIDGQLSIGPADDVAPVPAWVGADGVDELLTGFTLLPGAKNLRFPEPRTLAVRTVAPDAGDGLGPVPSTPRSWLVTVGSESIQARRDPDEAMLDAAEASIAGAPHDVYCVLWNRPSIGEVALDGDLGLIEAWHAGVQVV